jgi:hypothetical protein
MVSQEIVLKARFDPELPTARDVLVAISCVATQYAMNPSLGLAKTALTLANNLNAPEYADGPTIQEVAQRLTMQWDAVVEEYLLIEASVIRSQTMLQ